MKAARSELQFRFFEVDRAAVVRWLNSHDYPDSGVIFVCKGQIFGWRAEAEPVDSTLFRPGVLMLAVDLSHGWRAVGGDIENGARRWEAL